MLNHSVQIFFFLFALGGTPFTSSYESTVVTENGFQVTQESLDLTNGATANLPSTSKAPPKRDIQKLNNLNHPNCPQVITNSDNTILLKIGVDEIGKDLKEQIKVCYNQIRREPFWSEYLLISDPKSSSSSVKSSTSFSTAFTATDQMKGKLRSLDNIYKDAGASWTKGHLTPAGSFYSKLEKDATNYYVNVAPQLSYLNKGWWRIVEDSLSVMINSLDGKVRFPNGLRVVTGILFDPNILQPTLIGDKDPIRVPHYFWKIVIDPSEDMKYGVAFIGINDVYQMCYSESQLLPLCSKNKCKDLNIFNDFSGATADLVYCCEISDFKEVLNKFGYGEFENKKEKVIPPYIDNDNKVMNLLKFKGRQCPRPSEEN